MAIRERIKGSVSLLKSIVVRAASARQKNTDGLDPLVANLIDEETILFLDDCDQEEVLRRLTKTLLAQEKIKDSETFYQAVMQREKIVSTCVGQGIAIPHAKLVDYQDFFLAIAILKDGIEWKSVDGSKVKLVFLIGGPAHDQGKYLQILSSITSALKDESLREKLALATETIDVKEILESFKPTKEFI